MRVLLMVLLLVATACGDDGDEQMSGDAGVVVADAGTRPDPATCEIGTNHSTQRAICVGAEGCEQYHATKRGWTSRVSFCEFSGSQWYCATLIDSNGQPVGQEAVRLSDIVCVP